MEHGQLPAICLWVVPIASRIPMMITSYGTILLNTLMLYMEHTLLVDQILIFQLLPML